jgi:hypothetical protein
MNELMYRSEAIMNIRPPHLKAYRGPPGIAKEKASMSEAEPLR